MPTAHRRIPERRHLSLIFAISILSAAPSGTSFLSAAEPPQVDVYGDPLPAEAAVRLGTARFRTARHKIGLGFAPDNRTLVTATDEYPLVVWDVATGRRVREICPEADGVSRWIGGLRLTANHRIAVTIGTDYDEVNQQKSHTVRLWDVPTGKLRRVLSQPKAFVADPIELTPDAKYLITGMPVGTINVWDLDTETEVASCNLGGSPRALAISPDGEAIAVWCSHVRAMYFWQWQKNNDPEKIERGVTAFAFSPDGKVLAEFRERGKEIFIRDVKTRKVLYSLESENGLFHVDMLAFAPDGRTLVVCNAGSRGNFRSGVQVWDLERRAVVRDIDCDVSASRMAISRDGRWLALAGWAAQIRVWDLQTGKEAGLDWKGHGDIVYSALFTPDGRTAITSGNDGTVRIWDAHTGTQRSATERATWAPAIVLSPDGRWFATSSLDDSVRIVDTETGREWHRFKGHGTKGGQRAVAFGPDGLRLVSWGDDCRLCVWDAVVGDLLNERLVHPASVQPPRADGGPIGFEAIANQVNRTALSTDAKRIAFCHHDALTIFDVETGKLLKTLPLEDGLTLTVAFSPDGSRIATSAWGRPIEIPMPDGSVLSTAGKNHAVRVREIDSGKEVFQLLLPDGGAGPVAFSSDGKQLAVATNAPESRLRLIDIETGVEHNIARDLPSFARCVAPSADGKQIACGFDDGTALIWNVRPKAP